MILELGDVMIIRPELGFLCCKTSLPFNPRRNSCYVQYCDVVYIVAVVADAQLIHSTDSFIHNKSVYIDLQNIINSYKASV